MSWVLIDDNVPSHPKFLAAGPAASWLWLAGVAYCRKHHTNGNIPRAAIGLLGVKSPMPLLRILLSVRLWEETQGGWLIHDYQIQYGDDAQAKAEKEAKHQKKVHAGRKGGLAKASKQLADASGLLPAESQQPALAQSVPIHSEPEQHGSDEPAAHPVKLFLALHESLFVGRFAQKPPKYSGRDAKIAKEAIDRYGESEAREMLRLFMRSSDQFVTDAGLGLNIFEKRLTSLVMVRARSRGTSESRPVDDAAVRYGV